MPTSEQIKQIEGYVRNFIKEWKKKSYNYSGYIRLLPEMQDMILCPGCSKRMTKLFGGHHIRIFSDKTQRTAHRVDECERMLACGKNQYEIAEALGMSPNSIHHLVDKIKARIKIRQRPDVKWRK